GRGGLSLHDGLAGLWRGRRIEVGDAERAQHGGGALRAAGDATFGAAIAESNVDDAHRLEGVERFGRGEIEACGLELLFDCAMDEEGERSNVDVGFDPMVAAVIDRPHVDHVLEIGKGPLDLSQLLVEAYRIDR